MTRKHYKKIAEVLTQLKPILPENDYRYIVIQMGNIMSEDNPRFDWGRWDQACGIKN